MTSSKWNSEGLSVCVSRRVCLADAKRFMMAGNFQPFSVSSSWTCNHDRSFHWRSPRPSETLMRHAEMKSVGCWVAKDGSGHTHLHRVYISTISRVKLVAVDSKLHSVAEECFSCKMGNLMSQWRTRATFHLLRCCFVYNLQQRFRVIFFEKCVEWSTVCLFIFLPIFRRLSTFCRLASLS